MGFLEEIRSMCEAIHTEIKEIRKDHFRSHAELLNIHKALMQDEQKTAEGRRGIAEVNEDAEELQKVSVKMVNSVEMNALPREIGNKLEGRGGEGRCPKTQHAGLLFYLSRKTNVIPNQVPCDNPDVREKSSLLYGKKLFCKIGTCIGWPKFGEMPLWWEGRSVKIKLDKGVSTPHLGKTICPDPGGGSRRGHGAAYWWEGG